MSTKKRILILGGGMVGSTMALDLASDVAEAGVNYAIRLADIRATALERVAKRVGERTGIEVETVEADLSDSATVSRLARESDLVLGALSSSLGYRMIESLIDAKVDAVDISFMPESPLDLNERAASAGVSIVVDCGVAPGLSNMLGAYGAAQLDSCESIEILVGGVPKNPKPPFHYKAAFSPADVIEEYVRPARYVVGGRTVVRDALSEPELVEFIGVGTFEAFNTDGLRTMVDTLDVPTMKEKTLRWPGHRELMQTLRDAGFFSTEEIEINGALLRPLDATSAVLFPRWRYEPGEADLTVMRVRAVGSRSGGTTSLEWNLYDEYDPATDTTSMSRTTAFPATIVARWLLDGRIPARGVIPPERLADVPGLVDDVISGMCNRGVRIETTTFP